MSNLNPVIAQALAPFLGSMGMLSANPVADASAHFGMQADTFTTDLTYIGLSLCVEVNRHSRRLVDIVGPDGADLYYEFSEKARQSMARMVLEAA